MRWWGGVGGVARRQHLRIVPGCVPPPLKEGVASGQTLAIADEERSAPSATIEEIPARTVTIDANPPQSLLMISKATAPAEAMALARAPAPAESSAVSSDTASKALQTADEVAELRA